MRTQGLSSSICLGLVISFLSMFMAQPIRAQVKHSQPTAIKSGESFKTTANSSTTNKRITRLSEIERPATNASGLLSQSSTPQATPSSGIVQITEVKANSTNKGVEVILKTPVGTQLQVTNRSTGNNFIIDVSGGQLRLPDGNAFTFRSQKPLAGITEITATNIDANTVRVTVVGVAALPTVELFDDDAGLVFAVASQAIATQPPQTPQTEEKPALPAPQQTPSTQGDEPIELVVTGEQDGYRVPNSSTATRTDTPLRDIPQSIQVVPRQVLEDRNVTEVNQAIETVSGVLRGPQTGGGLIGSRIIRGFLQEGGNYRNGFRDGGSFGVTPTETIEQVEVLKGPASVLFGAVEPGGIVNFITRDLVWDCFMWVSEKEI